MLKMLKKERGIALVTVLMLMGIISALIAALVLMSRTEMWLSLFGSKQRQALYMAETGNEQFISTIPNVGEDLKTGSLTLLTNTGTFIYTPSSGPYRGTGADQGRPFFATITGSIPIGANLIQRTIEVEVLWRTYEAGKTYQTPRYPWE